ncbi:PAS domain S-box protein [Deinococcus budaensis]|uniref:Putative two-component system response regulator n=1 Tax=Deinococcus budaensis TaxID=1665626 RepID=A0A7W8GES1_9DEIO|nr:PAS domain S-box protein [Deinococcus budaensis]MBB5234264.1 putative two-component system response regulator [Deinococcus budaensis]
MLADPSPVHQDADAPRLAALHRYAPTSTTSQAALDRTAALAAQVFRVPVAAVTFIDADQQWFTARVGVELRQAPRSTSFCTHVVRPDGPDVLVVPDTRADVRFRHLPVVVNPPFVRFYAGAPLVTPDGFKIGTLCLYDMTPRPDLTPDERATLQALADNVVSELELRRTLAVLERERKIHSAVLASALDGMIILDRHGRVTEWNPAAEALLGFTRDEACGRALTEVMVPPEYHAVHQAGLARVIQDGDTRKRRVEVPALRRDGATFPSEFTLTPFDVDGEPMFMVYVRDLTDTQAARDALTASHALLRTVVDSVPEAIFVKDLQRRYVMINAAGAAQIGLSAERILGRTDDDLFPHGPATASKARDEAVLNHGQPLTYEATDPLPDGTQRTYWSTKVPTREACGQVTGLVGVAIDITERQAAEAMIRRHNGELTTRIEAAQLEILHRLARAAEYRDDDTGEHMGRVALTAAGLARELGLPDEEVALMERTAPLHDVGKIGIPDGILLKPGRLTPEEFEAVKAHTLIGSSILSGGQSPLVERAEEIARTHHERWDGSGYPLGLAGEAIPLSGRIVAVADVLDALTNDRPYKQAWSFEAALAEIRSQSGRHFDPRVVAALERLVTRR